MSTLRRAWAVTAPDAAWIAAVGLLQGLVSGSLYLEITGPLAILSIPVGIVLYGRILGRLVPGETMAARSILVTHGFNWLAVMVIVGLPLIVLRALLQAAGTTLAAWITLSVLLQAAVAILAMYALPLALLHRKSLAAVVGGVAFLGRNPRESAWIAWILLATVTAGSLGIILFRLSPSGGTFAVTVVAQVGSGLLGYTAFAGALGNVATARPAPGAEAAT